MRSILFILSLFALLSCSKPQEGNASLVIEGDYIDRETTFESYQGWKFRCKVYAEKQTVEDYGGRTEFIKKVDQLLSNASSFFSVEGINDEGGNQMRFFMTDFVIFEGASSKYTQDVNAVNETEYDLRLIINEHALASDKAEGWYPLPYLSIGHSHKDGVFSTPAVKKLVSNLAKSRGTVEITTAQVLKASDNMVNSATFKPVECIMNDPLKTSTWSDYAKTVINHSADERVAKIANELLPKGFKAVVKNPDGSSVKDCYLKFYPVVPSTGKVSYNSSFEGELSVTGNFIFTSNPFSFGGTDDVKNYLVEIQHETYSSYKWMPFYEVVTACINNASSTFIYEINLSDEMVDIPEGDYINRQKMFAQLPGWKYRCKILVEEKTLADFKNDKIALMKAIDKLLAECSEYFQVPGINDEGDNEMHFFMTSIEFFSGLSKNYMYLTSGSSDPTYDLRIIFNAHRQEGDVSGGYLGPPYLAIGHDWPGQGGLWAGYGIQCLVHEMGHARGTIDLYSEELPASGNPINGEGYEAENCIMNYHYGNHHWSEYSLAIINASKDDKEPIENAECLPHNVEVNVHDSNGNVANGAVVKFYPVYPYSNVVTKTPIYETTISGGKAFQMGDAFVRPNQSDRNSIVANFLIEVEYNGKKHYDWMPVHLAMLQKVKYGKDTYSYTFKIQ